MIAYARADYDTTTKSTLVKITKTHRDLPLVLGLRMSLVDVELLEVEKLHSAVKAQQQHELRISQNRKSENPVPILSHSFPYLFFPFRNHGIHKQTNQTHL